MIALCKKQNKIYVIFHSFWGHQGDRSPKNLNSVITYSPSHRSKPSFIFRTQIKTFFRLRWNPWAFGPCIDSNATDMFKIQKGIRQETKMPWCQTPSRKKKAGVFTTVTTSAYQDQLNAGFSKVCEIFKVHGIESLKYVREFYTPVCYCGDISTPRNVMLNKTNCDWLFDMSVKLPHGRALANKCHLLAMRD